MCTKQAYAPKISQPHNSLFDQLFHNEKKMPRQYSEGNMLLALRALQTDPNSKLRPTARLYKVNYYALRRRHNGIQSRRDWIPKSRKLSNLEEQIIVRFILDLDSRGFPPRLHENALLRAQVRDLQQANETLSRRRRAKRTRLQRGGVLTVREAREVIDHMNVDRRVEDASSTSGGQGGSARPRERRCGGCGKTGHNARTC
jgi:hypothetical protein